MNGGLASPAARRSEVSESASRSRREPAARAPAPELMAPRMNGEPAPVPGTRERMQASFGAAELAPVLPIVPPAAEALTTRDRIVNRALAVPEAAPLPIEPAAVVVDLAPVRERRRERRPETTAPPGPRAPLAPVIILTPRPAAARGPPAQVAGSAPGAGPARGDVAASAAPARAPPEAKPEESAIAPSPEPGATPEPEAAPEGVGHETSPMAGAAPSADAAQPAAAPEAAGAPTAAPEAAAGEPAPAAPTGAPTPPQAAAAEAAAPPVVPGVIRNPEDEPGFQAMKARTQRAARRTKRHQPGGEGAATAQGASAPDPVKDVNSQAADAQVETMGKQEPGPYDPAKFKADVKKAVEGMAPPATLEEADEFKESGKAAGAATWMEQFLVGGKETAARDIKVETVATPNPAGLDAKPVSKMVNDAPGPPLPEVGAAAALPGRRPPEQIDISAGPLMIDAKLAEANVTEEQLANANEPDFTGALDARQEVRDHAATDPVDYRNQEDLVLARGRAEAENVAAAQLQGMHGVRTETLGGVLDEKHATKSADQQMRDDIHQSILDIHEQTQSDVQKILETLDTTVDTIFTSGEKAARDNFEEYVARKMREYKADRYGGLFGGAKWLKDRFFDLPDEVNDFYRDGRNDYLKAMDVVIEVIAVVVGMLLGAAQLRIQAGREQVRTFVAGLDLSVQALGQETADELDNRFDQLSADVDSKRDELVDTVARKYVESRDELDTRIKELQEANKGLVSKAIDAVVGVLKTIYELGKLLLRVLLKAAAAIGDIVAHPIRFLENLVGAVKGGLDRFIERFPQHLQESLVDLLFGELGGAGITIPKQLDFAGILDLVMQVLGLTYQSVRERVVKRFGEEAVAKMEEKVDIFKTLVKDGVAGLWTWIQEKLTDLEDLVIGKIKEYVIERVVKAGIGYIVALLNPAAAFIKACQGIYQIVMFIVERAKQIADFVDAILDSISAIAQGNVGAAVEKIDNALAGALTLAIGFLARLANLGALSEKVRSIIALVRKPITRVVDQIVFGAAEVYRRTLGPAVSFAKAKVQSGKEFMKGKAQAVRDRFKRAPQPAETIPPAAAADAPDAAAPVPEGAGPLPLVIHEPFRSEGHTHEIYTGADGKQLVLASNGPTPITAIGDPRLNALHAEYLVARTRYDEALEALPAALAANPNARTGWTTLRDAVDVIVDRVIERIRELQLDTSPRASAPGIGDVRRHDQQGSSLRHGPPLWYLESEHVIPFAVGKMLWDAVGELVPGRGRVEDNQQTTIMLYKPASDEKTRNHDTDAWKDFKNEYLSDLQPLFSGIEEEFAAESETRRNFERVFNRFRVGLERTAASAVAATWRAVQNEHDSREHPPSGETNGGRRAEADSLPTEPQIEAAAEEQQNNVYDLTRQAVERGLRR
jgi:hypothetical protein